MKKLGPGIWEFRRADGRIQQWKVCYPAKTQRCIGCGHAIRTSGSAFRPITNIQNPRDRLHNRKDCVEAFERDGFIIDNNAGSGDNCRQKGS